MTRTPELLVADLRDELGRLAELERQFDAAVPFLDLPAESVSVYDRGAIGYLLHNFYNGCENCFRAIAGYFENDLGADSWHADLLRRMRLAIPGYRPAVIDEPLFRLLDDFRGFRHVFRNAYGFELDWERERLVASRLRPAAAMFRAQLGAFIAWVETTAP
jgi:hypothetical protein